MEVVITQTLKPLRLLFLTVPYSKNSFEKAVHMASSYFGGKYFPIIPFYKQFSFKFSMEQGVFGRKIGNYYNQLVENYSVDFVIYDDRLDIEKIKPLIKTREVVPISVLEKSLTSGEPRYGCALHQMLANLRDKEYKYVRIDQKKMLFTRTNGDGLIWKALFGDLSNAYKSYLGDQESFGGQDFYSINDDNAMDYFHDGYQNILDIGAYGINKSGYDRDLIYWIDETDILSINNFWNLRALGANIIAVPSTQLNNGLLKDRLKKVLARYHNQEFWYLTVVQVRNEDDGGDELAKALFVLNGNSHKGISYCGWYLRYWEDDIYKRADHIGAANLWVTSKKITIETKDYLTCPVLKPDFMKESYHSHIDPVYTNSLNVRIRSRLTDYGETFPRYNDNEIGRLFRTASKVGITSSGINFYPHLNDDLISFTLPRADDLLGKLFEEKKLMIRPSSAGKLTREVLKNLGSVYGVNVFNNRIMVDLLLKFRNGQTQTKKSVYDYLQKNQHRFQTKHTSRDRVDQLVTNKFIRLGATVDCSFCNRGSFYTVDELNYHLTCKVCENVFLLPSADPDSIKWSYQGMGPFALNNAAEGSISVLLTMRFFKTSTMVFRENTTILGTSVVQKNNEIMEIDITLFQQHDWSASRYPDLIFGECKTDNDFLPRDVERMGELGKLFPGSILLFATLKKQLTREEKRQIKRLANSVRVGNQVRPINPILILTGNELLPDRLFDGMKQLEQHKIQTYHNDDSLGHLCEMSNIEYLGLKPYRQIVESRYRKKWEKSEHEIQTLEASANNE